MVSGFLLAIFLFSFLLSVSEPAAIDWGGIGGRIEGKYLSRRFWIPLSGLYAQATSPCGGIASIFSYRLYLVEHVWMRVGFVQVTRSSLFRTYQLATLSYLPNLV